MTNSVANGAAAEATSPGVLPPENAEKDGSAYPPDQPIDTTEYRLYPVRWFALFALATLGTSNTLNWNTFAPVSNLAAQYFDVSVSAVSWLGTTIYLSLVVTGLFSAWVIDTRGLRVALICGAILNGLGSWIRYFGSFSPDPHTRFAIAMVGQTMVGIGRPFATSCTTRLASTFFGMHERTFANTLATVSPSFGIITSSAATSYIITSPDKTPLAMLLWACWSLIPAVLVWFVPEKPPTPASPSGAVMTASRVGGLEKWKRSFKTAFTNVDFICLWMLMSGQLSLFFIYLILVSSIMLPSGFTPNQIGFVFVVIVATGWLALPISKLLDRTGKWILALRLLLVFCTVGFVGLTLALQAKLYWAIMLSAAVYGYSQFPTLSIVFELGMECTYPHLLPAMMSYLISALAQIIGVILTPLLSNVANKTAVLWVLTGISAGTVVISLLYRGKTKRLTHDTTVLDTQKMAKALDNVKVVDEDAETVETAKDGSN